MAKYEAALGIANFAGLTTTEASQLDIERHIGFAGVCVPEARAEGA